MTRKVLVNCTDEDVTEAMADMAKAAQRAAAVTAAAHDPEGQALVQAILERKAVAQAAPDLKLTGRRHHP